MVVDPLAYEWRDAGWTGRPWEDAVFYELHVGAFTAEGSFAAAIERLDYLADLGVTAVELMPLADFPGRRNWGYDGVLPFAPDASYGTPDHLKHLVQAAHRHGLMIFLDVVYNHTAEGNHLGPVLSFRGLDNRAYYRLDPADPRRYIDYTGTGNSLNMRNPHVLQLIMDSLRYWVTEMHVDGFRFDLASALARELHDVDRLSAFFDIIQQDPVISRVKLIAEPWDVGEGGYQVGNFPPLWSEWNGKYRDTVRDFWRGRDQTLAELAYRLTGSSDLYESSGRRPYASINFVTAHDGFTVADLVSYNEKHNSANGENNQDGENDNRSWNCSVEGPTNRPDVLQLRARQRRNFLATLFLSQGIPMLLGGDEVGRTQRGNNNAYCQDNDVSWYDWNHVDEAFLAYTRRLIKFRREHPVFRRRRFFQGRPIHGSDVSDIGWFTPEGTEMTEADWRKGLAKAIAVFLNGEAVPAVDIRGDPVVDDTFFLLFNGSPDGRKFVLPAGGWGELWVKVLDTTLPGDAEEAETDDAAADLRGRVALARERLDAGDTFVFCHVKSADAAGHTKDPRRKQAMIETLDTALADLPADRAIVCLTGDRKGARREAQEDGP